jgi:hypothetical protein
MLNMSGTPPHSPPRSPSAATAAPSKDIANLLTLFGQLSTAMAAQAEASARTLAEAEHRFTADPTPRTTVTSGMIAASAPFAVFGGDPVTTRTINDLQTVGRKVISRMERASIIDRDLLDKISKKIRRAIAPGFQYIDINKLLESATGSAIVQPIQLLQDLYIELNNSLAETCHSVSSIQYQSYTPGHTTASLSETHKINRAPTNNNDSVMLQKRSYDYNCRLS